MRRRRLLDIDPEKRLGSLQDGDEVMHHEWFEGVNWERTAKVGVHLLSDHLKTADVQDAKGYCARVQHQNLGL